MRKLGIALLTFIVIQTTCLVAWADTINPEEARVIDAASGYFVYENQKYVATQASLSELTAYLNQDGVDLTSSQADRAIDLMHYDKNIKSAIDGGYLVPVNDGGQNGGNGDTGSGDNGGSSGNEDSNRTNDGSGNSGGDGGQNPNDSINGDGSQSGNGSGSTGGNAVPGFVKVFSREGFVQALDGSGNLVYQGGLPIKNTGLGLSWIFVALLALAALSTGFLVKVKRPYRKVAVPAAFVVLLAFVVATAGASARQLIFADIQEATVLGSPETSYMDQIHDQPKQGIVDGSQIALPKVGTAYGEISCPRIEFLSPLYYGDDDETFEKGGGQYMLSGMPGQGKPILVGGHDVSYFAPLEKVKKGDVFRLKTSYGSFRYRVSSIRVSAVDRWNPKVLKQNEEQLILYTCYPFESILGARDQRLFVTCDKISGPEIKSIQ